MAATVARESRRLPGPVVGPVEVGIVKQPDGDEWWVVIHGRASGAELVRLHPVDACDLGMHLFNKGPSEMATFGPVKTIRVVQTLLVWDHDTSDVLFTLAGPLQPPQFGALIIGAAYLAKDRTNLQEAA